MSDWTLPQLLLCLGVAVCVILAVALLVALRRTEERSRADSLHARQVEADRMDDMERYMYGALRDNTQAVQGQSDALSQRLLLISSAQEERLERLRQTMQAEMTAMGRHHAEQLSEMRRTIDQRLETSLEKRLGESFDAVSRRLEQVSRGLGEMQTLASGVGDIKKMLSNVKTRGVWGEKQLAALLRQMLSPVQYEENCEVVPGSGERVEFALRVPGAASGDRSPYLAIDSKFPVENYLRLKQASEAGDQAGADAAERDLLRDMAVQAKKIQSKYIHPPYTVDYAVMYLPLESLYALAAAREDTLDGIQGKYRVLIAGPTTLCALLSSLQTGFQSVMIAKRSREIWQLLTSVKEDFVTFSQLLDTTRKRLQTVSDDIDRASGRSRQIQRQLSQASDGSDIEPSRPLPPA